MVDEGQLSSFQRTVGDVHLLPVLPDHPIHQTHLWPDYPALRNNKSFQKLIEKSLDLFDLLDLTLPRLLVDQILAVFSSAVLLFKGS